MVGGGGVLVLVADAGETACAITTLADFSLPPISWCGSVCASGSEIVQASPQVPSCQVLGINSMVMIIVNLVFVASPPSLSSPRSPLKIILADILGG